MGQTTGKIQLGGLNQGFCKSAYQPIITGLVTAEPAKDTTMTMKEESARNMSERLDLAGIKGLSVLCMVQTPADILWMLSNRHQRLKTIAFVETINLS